MDWMNDASCRQYDPELFFPRGERDASLRQAKVVCYGCPVLAECSKYSQNLKNKEGVWAGKFYRSTTQDNRRRNDER